MRSIPSAVLGLAMIALTLAGCRMQHQRTDTSVESPPQQTGSEEAPPVPVAPVPVAPAAPTPTSSITVRPSALNVLEGGSASYTVALSSPPTAPVTILIAAPAEVSVRPESLAFTPNDWAQERTVTVIGHRDDNAVPAPSVELAHEARGGNYGGVHAALLVTVVEVDAQSLAIAAAHAEEDAGLLRFAVSLSAHGVTRVTVDYESGAAGDAADAGTDYEAAKGSLEFPAYSRTAQTIEVTVTDDALDEPDEHLTMTLSNPQHAFLAGGENTATATGTIEDDDEPPQVETAGATAGEDSASMEFTVALHRSSGQLATLGYATRDVTAEAGADYTGVAGTLTFSPGTTAQTILVPVLDDDLDEEDETFLVALSNAQHVLLPPDAATGTIADDDMRGVRVQPTELTVAEGDQPESYTVTLTSQPTADITVAMTTDPAAAGVSVAPAELTFAAHRWASAQTVSVAADQNATGGDSVTIDHAVSGGDYTGEPAGSVTVTIMTPAPARLTTLQVTGGGTMYPAFDRGILHYALACADSTTLQITAQASRTEAVLTLLRANSNDNAVSNGTLDTQVTVDRDHDIAIELSDMGETTTYVVHCIPPEFPDSKVLKKTEQASQDSLLFVTPSYKADREIGYLAILDYNGVPRFHRDISESVEVNFRRQGHADGWYSVARRYAYGPHWEMVLLNEQFEQVDVVRSAAPLTSTSGHDFLFNGDNRLFISFNPATRDFEPYGGSTNQATRDSIIQEVSPQGTEVYRWNSWDNHEVIQLGDCTLGQWPGEYAHLNSLQLIDGDIIASFRRCSQVLRIDWSGPDRGTVKWKLGGTAPQEDTGVEHLEIVGDDIAFNEFCGQHQVTLMPDGKLVLFDNGVYCIGPRKAQYLFTRVVEYDISSGTQAVFEREYKRPSRYGYSDSRGGVTVLDDNTRWLIAWGSTYSRSVALDQTIAVSEIDPASGTAHFELHLSKGNNVASTYRAYRESEADVSIPLNLP